MAGMVVIQRVSGPSMEGGTTGGETMGVENIGTHGQTDQTTGRNMASMDTDLRLMTQLERIGQWANKRCIVTARSMQKKITIVSQLVWLTQMEIRWCVKLLV